MVISPRSHRNLHRTGFLHNRAINASNKSAINLLRFHQTTQTSHSRLQDHPRVNIQDGKTSFDPDVFVIVCPRTTHTTDTATDNTELKFPRYFDDGSEQGRGWHWAILNWRRPNRHGCWEDFIDLLRWNTDGLISKQVLAVDLLNPSPASEARKHKLKVCNLVF